MLSGVDESSSVAVLTLLELIAWAIHGIIKSNMKNYSILIGLNLCCALLSACANVGSMDFPGVYKIGIPQGNIITQVMIDQLRPGMTKRQVVFVMGTPLVRDPFNQDRWDYIYSFQPGGGERGQERVSVNFVDDALVSFTGDFTPTPGDETTETSDNPDTASASN